jgi:hypothetical protein
VGNTGLSPFSGSYHLMLEKQVSRFKLIGVKASQKKALLHHLVWHVKIGRHGPLLVWREGDKIYLARSGKEPRGWFKLAAQPAAPWQPAAPPIAPFLVPLETFREEAALSLRRFKRLRSKARRAWRDAPADEDDPAKRWLQELDAVGKARAENSWAIGQFSGPGNDAPDVELYQLVERWLIDNHPPYKARSFSGSVMAMEAVPF